MNIIIKIFSQLKRIALKAFQTFPAAIANALAFSIVTAVRIHLDWPEQEAYNFLFNCLHLSFAFGAIFSMAAITYAKSHYGDQKTFAYANLFGGIAPIVMFLLLYYLGQEDPEMTGMRYKMVSSVAALRVSAAIFISFLAFVWFAGYPKEKSDFAKSLFMTHKAFFIASIYGSVIMSGTSGVAGAYQALLYNDMSSKVYMYIGTITGFVAFTIFAGYFPDFTKDSNDEHRLVAQKQPRFVEVLFQSILVPIVVAMTVVLLLWAGKTILEGMKANFVRLSAIASLYAVGGLWLHIMITHNKTGIAKFYKMIFPITALLILAFEAWAFILQLQKYGLKTTEYNFIVVWIVALASSILLIARKDKAHRTIVIITCMMAIVVVMPVIGLHDLPIRAQVNRLEKLLIQYGMFESDKITPAAQEPSIEDREAITDAVSYLASQQSTKLPVWFDKKLINNRDFETTMGFAQAWPKSNDYYDAPGNYMYTSLYLQSTAIDISDYDWALNLQDFSVKGIDGEIPLEGKKGTYHISWTISSFNNIPALAIRLDKNIIIENDMNDYMDAVMAKYPPGNTTAKEVPFDDMSLTLESEEIFVLLVFRNIDINVDLREDVINYYLNLEALYIKEK